MYNENGLKQTELGLLPKEWDLVSLGNVINLETGKRMKGGGLDKGEVISIGGEHIDNSGNLKFEKIKYISEEFYKNLKQGKVFKDDVLVVKDGATTGKAAFIKSMIFENLAINEHVFILRSKNADKLINIFLFLFIFSKKGQEQIKKEYHGLIGGINREEIKSLLIPLPPLPEQKKIATVLSAVQDAKEKTKAVINAAKELKKSLMKYLFTYGPVPINEAENVKLKETEIGMIPEEWEILKLIDVAEVKYGKANPKDNGNIPVVGSGGIYSTTKITLVDFPTIIIGRKGSAGNTWLFSAPCYPSDTTFYLKWEKDIDINFLFNYLIQNPISGEHAKTTLPSLQKPDLEKQLIPYPQAKIQLNISDIFSKVDKKIETEENKKKALEELFKTLLNNLMVGKIRVGARHAVSLQLLK